MSSVTIDGTGVLVIDGRRVFPIGFSEPPPVGAKTANGVLGLDELRNAGGNLIRIGPWDFGTPAAAAEWQLAQIAQQIARVRSRLDEAQAHGMHCWLFLGKAPNLPVGGPPGNEQLLQQITSAFKSHPALGVYKGYDEPAWGNVAAVGLVAAYNRLRALDPDHPVVIIQAPRQPVATLEPYRPAFDVTGVDIFPIAYHPPAAWHSDSPNHDISVVGEMVRKMVAAAAGKPVWATLQIAWAGTVVSETHPQAIPCFPTLPEQRFMTYHAIVAGARGISFFGGHLTQACRPDDAKLGWNWAFWRRVLRPVVNELGSADLQPALLAANAADHITTAQHGTTAPSDIELVARRAGQFLYLIAVKTSASGVSLIDFGGLPANVTTGEVLFEYVQVPPPRPFLPDHQVARPLTATNGHFQDWFRSHDVHVYRFTL